MKKKLLGRKAFTLIELLVVITIIGILASLAIPTIGSAIAQANQTKDLNNITQTGRTLFMDANDNGGTYRANPAGTSGTNSYFATATLAFQDLLGDGALSTPSVLLGTGMKPAANTAAMTMDNVAWAYMVGLRTSSNPNIPLLVSYGSHMTVPADLTQTNGLDISNLAEGLPSTGGALWSSKAVLAYYAGGNAKIMKPGKDGASSGHIRIVDTMIATPPAGIKLQEP